MAEIKQLKELLSEYLELIDRKCHKGCKSQKWVGFENGNGQECGKHIDELIERTKKILNDK